MDYSPNTLKYAPWSISKADCAKQCGLRFYLKHIEFVREPKETPKPESRVGSAAHKAIELILKGKDEKRAFITSAVDWRLTTKETETLMTFQGTIRQFIERVARFKEKNPVKEEFVEHKFGLSINLKPTTFKGDDVFFRGVWDYTLHTENEDLVIFDHKSGQPSPEAENAGKHTNQLNSYALAGRKLFPRLKGVQSAIHYLRDGSLIWGEYTTVGEIDEGLTEWFVDYLNGSVEKLERVGNPGWYCGYCGYAGTCTAYQERNK